MRSKASKCTNGCKGGNLCAPEFLAQHCWSWVNWGQDTPPASAGNKLTQGFSNAGNELTQVTGMTAWRHQQLLGIKLTQISVAPEAAGSECIHGPAAAGLSANNFQQLLGFWSDALEAIAGFVSTQMARTIGTSGFQMRNGVFRRSSMAHSS